MNNFLSFPNDKDPLLNSSLTITNRTYRHSPAVASVVFHFEAYSGGAHPETRIGTQTFDLTTPKVIGIQDLFLNGVDPVSILAPLVSQSLKQQYGNDGIVQAVDPQMQSGKTATAQDYGQFALDATTLYLFFPPERLGPMPAGGVTVRVPLSSLSQWLKGEYLN